MKWSRRELSINMVLHKGILKKITTLRSFTVSPKTGVGIHCEN